MNNMDVKELFRMNVAAPVPAVHPLAVVPNTTTATIYPDSSTNYSILDNDVVQLEQKLVLLLNNIKQTSVQSLLTSKQRLLEECDSNTQLITNTFNDEKESLNNNIQSLHHKIEVTKTYYTDRDDKRIDQLDYLHSMYSTRCNTRLLINTLIRMKIYTSMRVKHRKQVELLIIKQYNYKLMSISIKQLWDNMNECKYSKQLTKQYSIYHDAMHKLTEKYNAQEQALLDEIDNLKNMLSIQAQHHKEEEDKLKEKVIMTLNNINVEALSLFDKKQLNKDEVVTPNRVILTPSASDTNSSTYDNTDDTSCRSSFSKPSPLSVALFQSPSPQLTSVHRKSLSKVQISVSSPKSKYTNNTRKKPII